MAQHNIKAVISLASPPPCLYAAAAFPLSLIDQTSLEEGGHRPLALDPSTSCPVQASPGSRPHTDHVRRYCDSYSTASFLYKYIFYIIQSTLNHYTTFHKYGRFATKNNPTLHAPTARTLKYACTVHAQFKSVGPNIHLSLVMEVHDPFKDVCSSKRIIINRHHRNTMRFDAVQNTLKNA